MLVTHNPPGRPLDRNRHDRLDAKQKFQRARGRASIAGRDHRRPCAGAPVPQTGYLEPLLAGATLAISPLLVLFAVFFWSFIWGFPGSFIGVPATIAMLTMCAQYGCSRWLAVLLSDSASRK